MKRTRLLAFSPANFLCYININDIEVLSLHLFFSEAVFFAKNNLFWGLFNYVWTLNTRLFSRGSFFVVLSVYKNNNRNKAKQKNEIHGGNFFHSCYIVNKSFYIPWRGGS